LCTEDTTAEQIRDYVARELDVAWLAEKRSVGKYLSPESQAIVPTVWVGSRRAAILRAAATLAPVEVPANSASSVAGRLVISFASAVETWMITSALVERLIGGTNTVPMPSIL
jgi:hypothetical protein